jgi:micrococcal nuclease
VSHRFHSVCLIPALLLAAIGSIFPPPSQTETPARPFQAKVVSIQDGDTITVLRGRVRIRIRLHGIDAPELGQPYGRAAKRLAGELAHEKHVEVTVMGRDRYGRTAAAVKLPDGRVLSHELVRAGLAWWYGQFAPKDDTLKRLEAEARAARRGLWAESGAVAPWEWRRTPRAERR